jgi:hypothetical protein
MLQVEKHITLIALIFISISTWFYFQSLTVFSIVEYMTIVLPTLLLTLSAFLLVRLMGRFPEKGIPIISHTMISVWPTHTRRRQLWISAALSKDGNRLIITTLGKIKSSLIIEDIVSSIKTENSLLVTLKSGEKWDIAGVESLEVAE